MGGACPETDAAAAAAAAAWLEPLTLPCVLAAGPEDRLLARALGGLQLAAEGPEDSARLKRSFSLDIKSYGELGGASGVGVGVGGAGGVSGGGGGVGGGGGGGGSGGGGGGGGAPHRVFAPQGDAPEYFKPSAFNQTNSTFSEQKMCSFSYCH